MAKRSIGYELSKSTLIRSVQCQKSLYLYKYHSQLREKPSYTQQATFNRGHSVGYLAQQLFPMGKDMTPSSLVKWQQSALATAHYIQKQEPILYEAAFIYKQVLVAVDMLVYNGTNWDVYEVKSSLKISETYLQDAAIQYYIIKNCGVDINKFFLVNLNGNYERNGDLNIQELFAQRDVTKELKKRESETQKIIENAIDTLLKGQIPDAQIGGQCAKPYPCDFMKHCWNGKMETEVFTFGGMNLEDKALLINQGIETITEKVKEVVSSVHPNVLKAHVENKPIFDKEHIQTFLQPLLGNLYFVDIEAFQPAVPIFDKTHPYQTLPFLFAILYFDKENQALKENIIFARYRDDFDAGKEFVIQFIEATKEPIPIVVYGKTFEKSILGQLAYRFPEFKKDLEERMERIFDLSPIFQKKYYYHPLMNGSASLKAIVDAIDPEIYSQINIKEGREAAIMYEAYFNSMDRKPSTENELIEYCTADTHALYTVWEHLDKLVHKE